MYWTDKVPDSLAVRASTSAIVAAHTGRSGRLPMRRMMRLIVASWWRSAYADAQSTHTIAPLTLTSRRRKRGQRERE